MAVSIPNSTSYESGSGGFNNVHTISSFQCDGSDSMLLLGLYERDFTDISTVEANSSGMTQITSAQSVSTNVAGVDVYREVISNASFDIDVTYNASVFRLLGMSALALSGVDQTTPTTGTPTTNTGFGTSATASYTGTSGNELFVFINIQEDETLTASNCTEIHNFAHADANLGQCFVGHVTATGSSQTIGATLGTARNWAISIVEVVAASAGVNIRYKTGAITGTITSAGLDTTVLLISDE